MKRNEATVCGEASVAFIAVISCSQRQRHASAARRKPMYEASEEDMGFGSFDCNEMADAIALHRYNTAQLSKSSEDNSVSTPVRLIISVIRHFDVSEYFRALKTFFRLAFPFLGQ